MLVSYSRAGKIERHLLDLDVWTWAEYGAPDEWHLNMKQLITNYAHFQKSEVMLTTAYDEPSI